MVVVVVISTEPGYVTVRDMRLDSPFIQVSRLE